MEEKDEFSDILLERDSENKASKLKKIMFIVGIFVFLFIVVLLVMRFFYKSDNSSRIVLPPENKPVKVEKKAKEDPLFKQVPIIEEDSKKESFEEMVKKLKEKESKKTQEAKDKKVPANNTKDSDLKPVEMKVNPTPIKEVKIIKKPKVAKKTEIPKVKVKQEKPKKQQKSKIDFKPTKPIPTIPTPSTGGKAKGIYIQVLATSKNSADRKFITKLKAKNYNYTPYETTVKGKRYLKILVGPYSSQKDARGALPKVKKDLNPKAFIFNIK